MLEWTDDLEVFILKGYGNSLNYRMGVPLLKDVVQSMDQAIKDKEGNITMRFWLYSFFISISEEAIEMIILELPIICSLTISCGDAVLSWY